MNTAFETLSQDLSDIIGKNSHAIVSIRGQRSASTGIHWRKGLIVTSCEALYAESNFRVSLPNGKTFETELMGSDPSTDIAVLSRPEGVDLPTAVLGDAQTLAIGQLVSTVGYAVGHGGQRGGRHRRSRHRREGHRREGQSGEMRQGGSRPFATLGMVAQLGEGWRSQLGGQIEQYIEVDLRIRRGSAGCPLINHSGQVVGFNTFGPRRNVLTIPAATVNAVVDQLQQRGKLSRGYLGLGMQAISLPENVRQQHGLNNEVGIMVVSVDPDSAADHANMQLGDVMLAFDDENLESLRQVQTLLGPQSVGQSLNIKLLRGGQLQTVITVTVGER